MLLQLTHDLKDVQALRYNISSHLIVNVKYFVFLELCLVFIKTLLSKCKTCQRTCMSNNHENHSSKS